MLSTSVDSRKLCPRVHLILTTVVMRKEGGRPSSAVESFSPEKQGESNNKGGRAER